MVKATLTFTENRIKASFYAALVLAKLINNSDPSAPVEIVHHDGALIVAGNKDSTVALSVDGTQIFGGKAVYSKLIEIYKDTVLATSETPYWVDFSFNELAVTDFKALTDNLLKLDDHLVLRTYIDKYEPTAADIAVWGAIKGSPQGAGIIKKGVVPNVERWYRHMESHAAFTEAATELLAKKQIKSSTSNYDIGLPDTEKGVVTRFPPEPSGYMHIGHAKAAMLNSYFANKYNGRMLVRFDDTNPSKEKEEYESSIIADIKTLGIKFDNLSYTSDYFQTIYEYAVKLIKAGLAYCDDTPLEEMRRQRWHGEPSGRRDSPIEENLQIFQEEMFNATEKGLTYCLRAKISFTNPNKAMRDPVIYRTNIEAAHHRTGTKWKIYPTYDFACPIVDSIEGVTHALRTTEYLDRDAQYQWMLTACGLREVHIWSFARTNFIKTLLSKRKLAWFVDQGLVSGWDDPRFPTVRGILRHGLTVEALREFVISQGPSKNVVNMEWGVLWAINKKIIDPVAPRYTAIPSKNIVKGKIIGGPEPAVIEEKPRHAKNPEVGTKSVYFSNEAYFDQADAASFVEGEEITLMAWGNAFVRKIVKEGDIVTGLELELHLEGDFKKTKKKVTWLSTAQSPAAVTLTEFGHLITVDKLEEGDDVANFVNKNSISKVEALADENIKALKEGTTIQFERIGYFRLDKAYQEGGPPAEFFDIPTGKN